MMSATEQPELTKFVRKSIQLLVEEAPKAKVAGSSGSGYVKHPQQGERQERRDFKACGVAAAPLVISDGRLGLNQPIRKPFPSVCGTAPQPSASSCDNWRSYARITPSRP
jgi:hypothetical protein